MEYVILFSVTGLPLLCCFAAITLGYIDDIKMKNNSLELENKFLREELLMAKTKKESFLRLIK